MTSPWHQLAAKGAAPILLPPPLLPPHTSRGRLVLSIRFGATAGGGGGGEVTGLIKFLAHEVGGNGIGRLEACEAEVSEFGTEVVVQEDVAGLEVAVQDRRLALGVEERERTCHIADDGEPLGPVQEPVVAGIAEEHSLEREQWGMLSKTRRRGWSAPELV